MSKLITIKNQSLTAVISTRGAELQSLTDGNNKEYIWQGDPAVWSGRAPVLFPICGGLKDDRYTLDGVSYSLIKHGFARNSEFEIVSHESDRAVFLLKDSAESYISYPFSFEFFVSFSLVDASLQVEYTINNLSDKTMYFSCGAHEGFALPDGIDGARVIFEKAEQHKNYKVTEGLLDTKYEIIGDGSDTLTLSKEYFSIDAIVLPEIASRSLTLSSADGTRSIRVNFPDFEHLLIWQVCGADYVCIEPWSGLPDIYGGSCFEIEKKPSITALEPEQTLCFRHSIELL